MSDHCFTEVVALLRPDRYRLGQSGLLANEYTSLFMGSDMYFLKSHLLSWGLTRNETKRLSRRHSQGVHGWSLI